MKKIGLILTLLIGLIGTASAQCNGIFGANQVCGTLAGGPPGPVNSTSLPGGSLIIGTTIITGGSSTGVLYNNSGILGGDTGLTWIPGGPLTINPTALSTTQALATTQTSPISGSIVGPLNFNVVNITDQLTTTGANQQHNGLLLNYQVGGANLGGAGPAIGANFSITEGIAGGTAVIDKIGVVGSCLVIISDVAGGGCYGVNPAAVVTATGSVNRLVGIESDIRIDTGGSASYRYAYSAVNFGAVQGGVDSVNYVANITANSGAFKGFATFSNSLGFIPFATTASLFSYEANAAATVADIFKFPNLTVTGNILNFPNVTLTGAGLLTLPDVLVTGGPAALASGQGSIGASAAGGMIVTGLGSSFDVSVNNSIAQNVCAVATGTRTWNCNTATLTNPLAVSSGGTGDAGTAWSAFTPSLVCGTATFTVNSASSKTLGKTTWAEIDYTITAIGTCTNPVTFTLPNTGASGAGLGGQENVNSSATVICLVPVGGATATCRKAANVNFSVNDRVIVSGAYSNQ